MTAQSVTQVVEQDALAFASIQHAHRVPDGIGTLAFGHS